MEIVSSISPVHSQFSNKTNFLQDCAILSQTYDWRYDKVACNQRKEMVSVIT